MLILLPPSEGKTAPRRGKVLELGSLSFPELADPRAAVLDALVSLCTTDRAAAATVLGLGRTQLDKVERNARLTVVPTARADEVYRGVLYEALDLATLDSASRSRATRWLAVTSGLFGLLRPADRIPAYRLSGNVRLPGLGPVATHWSRHLQQVVPQAAVGGLVVDLRSSTYASFWRPDPAIARRVATVRVLHEANGRRSVVSHFNKATKGRIVRALLEHGRAPRTPELLADHLTALGWKVETGAPGRHGWPLDVVVTEL